MRKYICIWGVGYAPDGETKIEEHPWIWFSEDLGYDVEAIDMISFLECGDSVRFNEMFTCHTVVRIA